MGCVIIAEAGVNHNGSLDLALRLIDAARAAGADIVKFQTFRAEALVTAAAPLARYQAENMGRVGAQLEMLKALELTSTDFETLATHCVGIGLEFLSTPFDIDSACMLARIGMKRVKVSSGDLTNKPFLRALAQLGLPMIVSSGMATLGETAAAVEVIEAEGVLPSGLTLLHCTTEYPAPMAEVNLRAMQAMAAAFPGIDIGYSDHTTGIEIPIAAVALGGRVIEKHLTLDRSMSGPDHKASLEPDEFTAMVKAIRNVESALGDGRKRPTVSELSNRTVARKSLVAACAIRVGDILDESNVAARRPGTGVSPMSWDDLIGSRADRDYAVGEMIVPPPR